MYYEEEFIKDKLMFRTSPNGEWQNKTDSVGIVANQLILMSKDQRINVLRLFCSCCGETESLCTVCM